jgi:hypothetical protein
MLFFIRDLGFVKYQPKSRHQSTLDLCPHLAWHFGVGVYCRRHCFKLSPIYRAWERGKLTAKRDRIEQARVYRVPVVWLPDVASKDCGVVRVLTALYQRLLYE